MYQLELYPPEPSLVTEGEFKLPKFRKLVFFDDPPSSGVIVYALYAIRSREQTRILLSRKVNGEAEEFF